MKRTFSIGYLYRAEHNSHVYQHFLNYIVNFLKSSENSLVISFFNPKNQGLVYKLCINLSTISNLHSTSY